MSHLDIIRDENTHRAITQAGDGVCEGGEALFCIYESK